jgi:hypothetical protein
MSRGINGDLIQDLNPKQSQIYYGPEIAHAVNKLGYVITKIHWVMEFEDVKPLFKEYMGNFWKVKKAASKGTVRYSTAKLVGNSLSGKFGQRELMKNTCIRTAKDIEEKNFKYFGFDFIQNGEDVLALITQEPNEKAFTSYPSYLSMAILAYSRILMSEYSLLAGCYSDAECTPFYGDTDSLILPFKTLEKLKPVMGSEIGQLDDEFCGGKALTFTGLALKTYNQIYVDVKNDPEKGHRVLSVTKCKGIPHSGAPLSVSEVMKPHPHAIEDIELIRKYKNDPQNSNIPLEVGLKNVVYEINYTDVNKEIQRIYTTHIGHDSMRAMLHRKCTVSCFYTSIGKSVRGLGKQTALSCFMKFNERRLGVSDWWNENKRRVKPDSLDEVSKPYGFHALQDGIECVETEMGLELKDEYDLLYDLINTLDDF